MRDESDPGARIALAVEMVARQTACAAAEAIEQLTQVARDTDCTVVEIADLLISGEIRFD